MTLSRVLRVLCIEMWTRRRTSVTSASGNAPDPSVEGTSAAVSTTRFGRRSERYEGQTTPRIKRDADLYASRASDGASAIQCFAPRVSRQPSGSRGLLGLADELVVAAEHPRQPFDLIHASVLLLDIERRRASTQALSSVCSTPTAYQSQRHGHRDSECRPCVVTLLVSETFGTAVPVDGRWLRGAIPTESSLEPKAARGSEPVLASE
jgi:hypothetical protein